MAVRKERQELKSALEWFEEQMYADLKELGYE
jgi:hypothetical protein